MMRYVMITDFEKKIIEVIKNEEIENNGIYSEIKEYKIKNERD